MFKLIAVASIVVSLGACSSGDSSSPSDSSGTDGSSPSPTFYEPVSLMQMLNDADLYSIFAGLVEASDYASLFGPDSKITVFIPVDKAFENVSKETLDKLKDPANKEILNRLVANHIIDRLVPEPDIVSGPLTMLSGDTVEAEVGPNPGYVLNMKLNGYQVPVGDMVAGQSIAHLIGGLLIPPGVDLSAL